MRGHGAGAHGVAGAGAGHVGAGDDVELGGAVPLAGALTLLALGGVDWGARLRAQGTVRTNPPRCPSPTRAGPHCNELTYLVLGISDHTDTLGHWGTESGLGQTRLGLPFLEPGPLTTSSPKSCPLPTPYQKPRPPTASPTHCSHAQPGFSCPSSGHARWTQPCPLVLPSPQSHPLTTGIDRAALAGHLLPLHLEAQWTGVGIILAEAGVTFWGAGGTVVSRCLAGRGTPTVPQQAGPAWAHSHSPPPSGSRWPPYCRTWCCSRAGQGRPR